MAIERGRRPWGSLGMIELVGLVCATYVADRMSKAADVEVRSRVLVGDGLVAIAVAGPIASVRWALDAAADLCESEGWLYASCLLGRPDPGVLEVFGMI